MRSPLNNALLIWSVRDVLRRPWDALLTGTALALVVGMVATAMLLTQSLANTTNNLMAEAPSLVVRCLNAGGWAPLPATEAREAALSVPGVIRAETRIWGVVRGSNALLTAVTVTPLSDVDASTGMSVRLPGPGQALIGGGVAPDGSKLNLRGLSGLEKTLEVLDTFPPGAGLFTHDTVLLHPEDARKLLSIPKGHASDLIIEVFHEEEESAIVPDLIKAFPFPVQITTRHDAMKAMHGGIFRRGSIALMVTLPSLLAMVLVILATIRERHTRRYEIGLLKAFGWSTGDIVRVSLYRALFVGIPAAVLGGTIAYGVVFWTGATWAGRWILGWQQSSIRLTLDSTGAPITLIAVAALVLVPFFAAVLFPVLNGALVDTQEIMEKEAV